MRRAAIRRDHDAANPVDAIPALVDEYAIAPATQATQASLGRPHTLTLAITQLRPNISIRPGDG